MKRNVCAEDSPVKVVAVLVFGEQPLLLGLLVNVVPVVLLDVRINDVDQLPAVRCQGLLHLDGGGEVSSVPCEVPVESQSLSQILLLTACYFDRSSFPSGGDPESPTASSRMDFAMPDNFTETYNSLFLIIPFPTRKNIRVYLH